MESQTINTQEKDCEENLVPELGDSENIDYRAEHVGFPCPRYVDQPEFTIPRAKQNLPARLRHLIALTGLHGPNQPPTRLLHP